MNIWLVHTKQNRVYRFVMLSKVDYVFITSLTFVGTGEHYEDIHVFDKDEFLTSLAGLGE